MELVEVGGTLEGHQVQPLQCAGTSSTHRGPTSPQMFPVLDSSGQERHSLKVYWKVRTVAHLIYEEKLRELGLVSLQKSRLKRSYSQIHRCEGSVSADGMEPGSSQGR